MKAIHQLNDYTSRRDIPAGLNIDVRSAYAEYGTDLDAILNVLKNYGPLPAYYALAIRIG